LGWEAEVVAQTSREQKTDISFFSGLGWGAELVFQTTREQKKRYTFLGLAWAGELRWWATVC